MSVVETAEPLDNVVWHALHGPLARFARPGDGPKFVRFEPEVGIFGAVDRLDSDGWRAMAETVGLEGFCGLARAEIGELPAGWERHYHAPLLQMVAGDVPAPRGLDGSLVMGAADAAEMLELVQLTEAAPFAARTHELGRYVGVRRAGKLIAMAGERFRVPGFVEVSAIATHPDARGEGLATELTLEVVRSIRDAGDEAFLHVIDSNENAVRLYRKLGFSVRSTAEVLYAQWHGSSWRPE